MLSDKTSLLSCLDYWNSLSLPPVLSIHYPLCGHSKLPETHPTVFFLRQQPYVVFPLPKTLKGPTQSDVLSFLTPPPASFPSLSLFWPHWPPCIFLNKSGAVWGFLHRLSLSTWNAVPQDIHMANSFISQSLCSNASSSLHLLSTPYLKPVICSILSNPLTLLYSFLITITTFKITYCMTYLFNLLINYCLPGPGHPPLPCIDFCVFFTGYSVSEIVPGIQ